MENTLFRDTRDGKRTENNLVRQQLAQRLQMPLPRESTLTRRRLERKRPDSEIVGNLPKDKPHISKPVGRRPFRQEMVVNAKDTNYIIRLERNNKILLRLARELDSYLYEPRTPTLFDRILVLKDRIASVVTKNIEIMGFLRHHRQTVGDYLDFIKFAFKSFYDLKHAIEAYMDDAHCGRPVSTND